MVKKKTLKCQLTMKSVINKDGISSSWELTGDYNDQMLLNMVNELLSKVKKPIKKVYFYQ